MKTLEKRAHQLKEGDINEGPVVYWMSRDQRIRDNWALLYAQKLAIKENQPLLIVFNVLDTFLEALPRSYHFMMEGLQEIYTDLNDYNIPFFLVKGDPIKNILQCIKDLNISQLITDFSPLKEKQTWNKSIADSISIPFYEVDTHNIVPVWVASDKKEYAAYTLRKKIAKHLDRFLTDIPTLQPHPYTYDGTSSSINWDSYLNKYDKDTNIAFQSGEQHAMTMLREFLDQKFKNYMNTRNDPNILGTSNLSPYLHYGQISAQRVVWEAVKLKDIYELKSSFYDEIIVRKEISDNFCYYEPNYDNFKGFHSWAQDTLNIHWKDPREYIYSREDFEYGKTHDKVWNAAQIQLVKTGHMHNYMRMYWAKKILEWTPNPAIAQEYAIYLNNKYELDGRDPNGYAGVAWSIGGVHDRAWNSRDIFGKIRYMSYNGLKRKFNIIKYCETYSDL
jgi:deoxyribodipyrimidine photo-lyase